MNRVERRSVVRYCILISSISKTFHLHFFRLGASILRNSLVCDAIHRGYRSRSSPVVQSKQLDRKRIKHITPRSHKDDLNVFGLKHPSSCINSLKSDLFPVLFTLDDLQKLFTLQYQSPTITKYLKHSKDFLKKTLKVNIAYLHRSFKHGGDKLHECEVRLFFDDPRVESIQLKGHAKSQTLASHTACCHAILHLASKEILTDLLPGGKYAAVSHLRLNEEANAKADILNYAARYDENIEFAEKLVKVHGRKLFECRAKLNIQNIEGIGRGRSRKIAEIISAIDFKRQAEEHQVKHGEGTLIVHNMSFLHSSNGKDFVNMVTHTEKLPKPEIEYNVCKDHIQCSISFPGSDSTTFTSSMPSKKLAEDFAYLCLAQKYKIDYPYRWRGFSDHIRKNNGVYVPPLPPVSLHLDCTVISTMQRLLQYFQPRNPFIQDTSVIEKSSDIRKYKATSLSSAEIRKKSTILKSNYEIFLSNSNISHIRSQRFSLPVFQYKQQILKLINTNDICIIMGATGSGKTTQVPQLILEEAIANGKGGECNIICTQPRRIAATSIAERVSFERIEPLQNSVGYHVRFSYKPPILGGSILFCTSGILLKQLQSDIENQLNHITHIIMDEVHERDIQIDFLFILLRREMSRRKALGLTSIKLILMSATIDPSLFAQYFGKDYPNGQCPSIDIPGRTFPVSYKYLEEILSILGKAYLSLPLLTSEETKLYVKDGLIPLKHCITQNTDFVSSSEIINWSDKVYTNISGEDVHYMTKDNSQIPYNLIEVILSHIIKTTSDGAVLVFLPGIAEIVTLNRLLRNDKPLGIDFDNEEHYKIFLLHSSIPNMHQEVFAPQKQGTRKIILSTNIAETSITIPDVNHVIDCGKQRELHYEPSSRITSLLSVWASKSNCTQRAGRAGRVSPGTYWSLMSKERVKGLRLCVTPEILRSDLQMICLNIKALGVKDSTVDFLAEAIEPPSKTAIESALQQLQTIDAIDEEENISSLGKILNKLPVEPVLGRMILLGILFRCLDPVIILASSMMVQDLFISPLDRRRQAEEVRRKFARDYDSDHIAIINAFQEWRAIKNHSGLRTAHNYASDTFLRRNSLMTIQQLGEQILQILMSVNLIANIPKKSRFYGDVSKVRFGSAFLNKYSDNMDLLKSLLVAGMYPNIASVKFGRYLRTKSEPNSMIHMTSINCPRNREGKKYGQIRGSDQVPAGTLYAFSTKHKDSTNLDISWLRCTTEIDILQALLFGGKLSWSNRTMSIDEWIVSYNKDRRVMETIFQYRKLLNIFLRYYFSKLEFYTSSNTLEHEIMKDCQHNLFVKSMVEIVGLT